MVAKKSRTEDEILNEYVDSLDNPLDIGIDQEEEIVIIQQMANIPDIDTFFRAMMGKDLKRYWQATDEAQRNQIKGAFSRLSYIRGMMRKHREITEIKETLKKRP